MIHLTAHKGHPAVLEDKVLIRVPVGDKNFKCNFSVGPTGAQPPEAPLGAPGTEGAGRKALDSLAGLATAIGVVFTPHRR